MSPRPNIHRNVEAVERTARDYALASYEKHRNEQLVALRAKLGKLSCAGMPGATTYELVRAVNISERLSMPRKLRAGAVPITLSQPHADTSTEKLPVQLLRHLYLVTDGEEQGYPLDTPGSAVILKSHKIGQAWEQAKDSVTVYAKDGHFFAFERQEDSFFQRGVVGLSGDSLTGLPQHSATFLQAANQCLDTILAE